jgi:hypothetical protein
VRSAGEGAGERALHAEFMSGRFKTSTSGGAKTYVEHYGEMWDRANAAAVGPGTPAPVPGAGAALDEPGPPVDAP